MDATPGLLQIRVWHRVCHGRSLWFFFSTKRRNKYKRHENTYHLRAEVVYVALPNRGDDFWRLLFVNSSKITQQWGSASEKGKLVNFLAGQRGDNLNLLGQVTKTPVDPALHQRKKAEQLANSDDGLTLTLLKEFSYDRALAIDEHR